MKLTIQDGRDSFYTFDSNRILLLTATDEEQIKQVEFSTEEAGGTETWTKDVLEQEDGVKYVQVPNEFLNGDYTRLVCYAVALDSKGEFTRQKEVFRIKYRPQPEDWFLTYSERVTFASIKALTEQYKSNASDSAELASKYAENNEDVAVEPGKYSAKHWSIKSNKKYEEIRSYVGSASDPESALGSIESTRANAVSDVKKQETDSIEAVGTYTSNTAIPSVSQYVEGTAKPALKTYGEQQVDSYVNGTSKPELDRYVNNEKKQVLDNYTAEKKSELDNYTETDKKHVLDNYTENEKKAELDSHTAGLKKQLNAHTVAKSGDLNEYTTGLKSELDGYTTAKEQDISEFTEQKKAEVQGVYQSDLDELKGDLSGLSNGLYSTVTVDEEIPIEIGTDGYYYYLDGTFKHAEGRQYAIIENVDVTKTYKLTTRTHSTLIAGVIYYNSASQKIGYEFLGDGTSHNYTKEVLTIPANCTKMIVQSTTTSITMHLYEEADKFQEKFIRKVSYIDVNVGNNYATNAVVTLSGFTGDVANGFTHLETTGGVIQLYNSLFTAGNYLVEFDCSYTDGEAVRVGFENDYKVYTYKGNTHLTVPLVNSDGSKTLFINSVKDNTQYTITNVKIRKIGEGETTVTLETLEILSTDNVENYGFWNIVLGHNTFTKAVGSTRSVAIGNNSLASLKGGHRNIGIGTFSMSQMNHGENNVSFGCDSMLAVQSATDCVAIGKSAMYNGTYHNGNVAIGAYAYSGNGSSESQYNVAIGMNAGINANGNGNTLIGHQAGYRFNSAYNCTMIGFNALGRGTGHNNVCIGDTTEFADGTHNAIALGSGVKTTKSNQMMLGNASITEVVMCGNKKIIFNNDGSVTWEEIT